MEHKISLWTVCACSLISLAVLALAAFIVAELNTTDPTLLAGAFIALAALLAAIPPIIRALRGGR